MKFFDHQKGNVLVFILVATGLFAFLTFAIMRSGSDSNTSSVSKREMDMALHEMIRYGSAIESAIDQMVMTNGVADNEISFESANDSPATKFQNTNCITDICKVFDISGGGVTWRTPPEIVKDSASFTDYLFRGTFPVLGHGSYGTDASNSELLMAVHISQEACEHLNDTLGLPIPAPSQDAIGGDFTGTYSFTAGNFIDDTDLEGEKIFCYQDTSTSRHYFTYVLLAR